MTGQKQIDFSEFCILFLYTSCAGTVSKCHGPCSGSGSVKLIPLCTSAIAPQGQTVSLPVYITLQVEADFWWLEYLIFVFQVPPQGLNI